MRLGKMYTKKEVEQKSTTEYQIGVCIKDTNQENGPGHVTTLLIKKKKEKQLKFVPQVFTLAQ